MPWRAAASMMTSIACSGVLPTSSAFMPSLVSTLTGPVASMAWSEKGRRIVL
jgi:hypothetical protein